MPFSSVFNNVTSQKEKADKDAKAKEKEAKQKKEIKLIQSSLNNLSDRMEALERKISESPVKQTVVESKRKRWLQK